MSEPVKTHVNSLDIGRNQTKNWWDLNKWNKINDFIVGAAIPIIVFTFWQLVGILNIVSPAFLPTPTAILTKFGELIASNELGINLGISVKRATIGFLIGGSLGLLLGLLTGFSYKAQYTLDPTIQLFRMMPGLALAPLIILWFGFGEVSKIVIIAEGAFYPLYLNTFMGIRNVDNKLIEIAKVLEFTRLKTIFKLILPSALPNILLGLRLSLAVSWLGLVVAELLGSQAGIGFLINIGKQNSDTKLIFVGIIIFAVIGKLVDSFVRILESKLLSWRDSYQG